MPGGPAPSAPIRFGPFEVDLEAGDLRKKGVRLKLQEQPLQILQLLLERPGDVITREELRQHLWPADTFVDFDHGLYNAIKRLREALGDTADTPRFIETLPKRGYRFIAEVNGKGDFGGPTLQEATAELAQRVSPAPAIRSTRQRWRSILLSASVAGVGAAALLVSAAGDIASNLRHWISNGRTVPPIHSLAVMPLQNLSGDPAQEYFADGMTEELITQLSSIGALKVSSRRSVMRYKKSDKSLPEIARELHVDGIVEGSVVRNGNEVRVNAQLIYAPEDKNIWARSYERQFQDSLTLQSEVASAVVGTIRAQIEPAEQARLQAARQVNSKALEAYLHGNYHFDRYGNGSGIEEADKALGYFRQAIAEDPSFAMAYASIAKVYCERISLPQAQSAPLIRAASEKALALDPNLADAHISLAEVKAYYDWDWQGAEREYKRAIELDPSNIRAHESFGEYLVSMGRMEEGLNEKERSEELDPGGSWHIEMGFYEARRYDQAIDQFNKYLKRAPTDGRAHFWLSESYAQKGMYKEAIQHLRITVASFGLKDIADSMDLGYAASGYKGAMNELARGTEKLHAHHQFTSGWIARFYLRLGDEERALKWLQQDFKEREDGALVGLNMDPVWDPLRSDAIFQDLVRQVGLPDIDVVAARNH